MSQEKVLLLGFGDIASRVACHLPSEQVTGVRRTASYNEHAHIISADCRDQVSMDKLISEGFDVIIMTFTPTERSDQGYKEAYVDTVQTTLHALDKQVYRPRLIIFISSSSVYPQTDSSWVDESSPTKPTNYNGIRLLEAESLLSNSRYTHCCVRFSGIYGRGPARFIQQVLDGKGTPKEPVVYTNRIHADDCAGVIAHLIHRQKNQAIDPLYLATDSLPAPLFSVKQWMAEQLHLPKDHLHIDINDTSNKRSSSKRCSNKNLLGTGYQFLYPSYQEGYRQQLNEYEQTR